MEVRDRLLVFSDYVCPYSYLAEQVLAPLRATGAIEFDVAAFELRPPGTPLLDLEGADRREEWVRTVRPLARELGIVDLQYATLATRTRKAHEAVAHAREHGAALRLHAAVFHAYWVDGRDIGRIDVLVELGGGCGLDRTALKVALDIDQWTARVEEDEAAAARLGLSAVPAYVLERRAGGRELLVGVQGRRELRTWLGWENDV